MKLRAEIVIDVDAEDYVSAAAHQTRIEEFMKELQSSYASAALTFRERRTRSAAMGQSLPPSVHKPTGRLHAYERLDEDA